jgi:hypothetical protein
MSSGGPNATTVIGYPYSQSQIRDASDYASYKKQLRIRNDAKILQTNNLGFIKGTGMLLDYREGSYKQGSTPTTCTACAGNAFIGLTGPISI